MEAKTAKVATKVKCMVVVKMVLDRSLVELDKERERVGRRQRLQVDIVLEWKCFGLGVLCGWMDSHKREMQEVMYSQQGTIA